MKNILIFTDLHLKDKDITECECVIDELRDLAKKYNVDNILNIGDTFDSIKPTALEQNLFSSFVKTLPCVMKTIVATSHESISDTNTVLSHYQILNSNIELYPTEWTDDNMMIAHWVFKEARKGFDCTRSIVDYKKYKLWFGGHQHSFEKLSETHYQLGSVRAVNFDESGDVKQVAVITNYMSKTQKLEFIPLRSAYPMETVIFNKGTLLPDWKSKSPLVKTRYLFKDLDSYKDFIPYEQDLKKHFNVFKTEFDLTKKEYLATEKTKEAITFEQSLKSFFVKNKTNEKIANIITKTLTTQEASNGKN
jgi:DNA repair exonuclease SbcCD nuclease subunit